MLVGLLETLGLLELFGIIRSAQYKRERNTEESPKETEKEHTREEGLSHNLNNPNNPNVSGA